jgi:hypothetical protein
MMMNRSRIGTRGLVLSALLCISASALAQDPPAPASSAPAPTFWQRVGEKSKEAAQAIETGVKKGAQEVVSPGSTLGDAYRPISPNPGSLQGIFPASESSQAGRGLIAWPRIALTVEEYGTHLDCWTFKAKIWRSETSSHDETFQICGSAPIRTKNDLGQEELTTPSFMNTSIIDGAMAMYTPTNTGSVATDGPTPPQWLFHRNIPDRLHDAELPILGRLLYVTGFINNIAGGNHDDRMWIASYNPNGNHG